jgi:hypothetical protein
MKSWIVSLGLAGALATGTAQAALTQSEQAQIRQLIGTAQLQNAPRVRSLVARPDLSADESAAALRDGLTPFAFDDARLAFVRDMLFGGASAASRSVLVTATVKALVARADALLAKNQIDLEGDARALAELARIYGFIDSDIANAGKPQGWAHDPAAGIASSAYDECAKALGEHIEKNQKVLRSDATVSAPIVRVRAQAQLALYEMIGDVPTRRVDAADKLGLQGARRAFLTELGVLLVDSGRADNARVERVRGLLERLPLARADAEAVVFGDTGAGLRSRNPVVAFRTPLEGVPWSGTLFTDEIDNSGPVDASMVELAREVALFATRRALDKRPNLRPKGERDYRAAGNDAMKLFGKPSEPSVDGVLATAVHLLVTDAPRTIDLAFVRFLAGHPESAAVLADALGAMAAMAPAQQGSLSIALGRPRADGTTETLHATAVQLAPNGVVTGFTLAGHAWVLDFGDSGAVTAIRRDGAPLTLAALPTARMPLSDGPNWTTGTVAFARLQGTPRAGVAPGLRARIIGVGLRGWDAIATPAPANDLALEATVAVRGEAGLAVRATADTRGLHGALLTFTPGPDGDATKVRVALVSLEDAEAFVTSPVVIPVASTYAVKLSVKGTKIEATVAGTTLKGTLPAALAKGEFALVAKRGATLDVNGLTFKR